jgi:FKBP12-rapamycin complex-associated protein
MTFIQGPETLSEINFFHGYGRDLQEARDWCLSYKLSNNINDMNQAWDLYAHVGE